MALAASIHKYGTAVRIAARNSASTWRNVIATKIATAMTLLALFAIYMHIFSLRGGMNGMTVQAVLWSIAMYSLYWSIGMRNVFRDIADDVKSGSVEVMINKPADYILLTIAQRFGRSLYIIAGTVFVLACILGVFVGLPPVTFSLMWFAQSLLLFSIGMIMSAVIFSLIGITAFWLDDPQPVMWIVDKSIMVLGGSIVPVALFPSWLRAVAEWSPMGVMLGFNQSFYPDFADRFSSLLASQLLWLLVLSVLTCVVWEKAKKKLSVYGG